MISRKFENVIREALDLVYPADLYCICCGKIIDSSRTYRLCGECFDSIRWVSGRTCLKCGKPLSEWNPEPVCRSCRENRHSFDQGITCCEYGMDARSVLFALKYSGRTDIGVTIAEIMQDRLESVRMDELLHYDAVIAVPMYGPKMAVRGYNQAEVIAKRLAKLERLPYHPDLLIRMKGTQAMRGLSPAERRINIAGAFAVPESSEETVRGKDLLVVDDIYTTGATADAAASTLKQAGAGRVDFITFAAGADVIKTE